MIVCGEDDGDMNYAEQTGELMYRQSAPSLASTMLPWKRP